MTIKRFAQLTNVRHHPLPGREIPVDHGARLGQGFGIPGFPRPLPGESSPRSATGGSSTSRTRTAVRNEAGDRSAAISAVRESERGARDGA